MRSAAKRQTFPWEPESARRAQLAMDGIRQLLLRRMRGTRGVHPPTLLSAVGSLAGFAAQNAALEQGEILARRRDLVGPKSLLLHRSPKGERFLFGNWINAPLLAGYGHAAPLQRFVVEAGLKAGLDKAQTPDFRAMEAQISASIGDPGFGTVRAPKGHTPAAKPRDLLRALWPQTRRLLRAPLPLEMRDEPALNEAHWPVMMSVLAGAFVTLTADRLDPRAGMGLVMESAIIASRLDPERIDPGHWELAPGRAGLEVSRDDSRRPATGG
jgi:hypothetical protein